MDGRVDPRVKTGDGHDGESVGRIGPATPCGNRGTRRMTWSVLVRDRASGALGAAVATRFFAVGALCIHVEGGVGALATQALINPMYALHGMARLREGEAPEGVSAALLGGDAGREHRQLHMLDAAGRIAQHTGGDCIAWCGAVRG